MNLDDDIRAKQIVNGPFEDMSQLSQALKYALRRGRNWEASPPESKEALELIATHLAKILVGDPSVSKHWNDMATLARLRGRVLEQSEPKTGSNRIREINDARRAAGIAAMAPASDDLSDLEGQE